MEPRTMIVDITEDTITKDFVYESGDQTGTLSLTIGKLYIALTQEQLDAIRYYFENT